MVIEIWNFYCCIFQSMKKTTSQAVTQHLIHKISSTLYFGILNYISFVTSKQHYISLNMFGGNQIAHALCWNIYVDIYIYVITQWKRLLYICMVLKSTSTSAKALDSLFKNTREFTVKKGVSVRHTCIRLLLNFVTPIKFCQLLNVYYYH